MPNLALDLRPDPPACPRPVAQDHSQTARIAPRHPNLALKAGFRLQDRSNFAPRNNCRPRRISKIFKKNQKCLLLFCAVVGTRPTGFDNSAGRPKTAQRPPRSPQGQPKTASSKLKTGQDAPKAAPRPLQARSGFPTTCFRLLNRTSLAPRSHRRARQLPKITKINLAKLPTTLGSPNLAVVMLSPCDVRTF